MSLRTSRCRHERGTSILEVLVAASILSVAAAGLLATFSFSVVQNQTRGEAATRTTDFARDKMEQLLALSFNDGASNTTVYPVTAAGGTGLGGTMAASATVGGVTPTAPVASYVDYLDHTGALLANATSAFYIRQWTISTDATATMKTITVRTTAKSLDGGWGDMPATTLVCRKTTLQ